MIHVDSGTKQYMPHLSKLWFNRKNITVNISLYSKYIFFFCKLYSKYMIISKYTYAQWKIGKLYKPFTGCTNSCI